MALTAALVPLAQAVAPFNRPHIDWHAIAPEVVLVVWTCGVIAVDLIGLERARRFMPILTGFGFLAAMIPVLTLWHADTTRILFEGTTAAGTPDGIGAYVVDQYALALKGMFLLSGYVVVLLSTNYMAEGDYYDSEYYQLIASSVLGMMVMASARDLITIFVALELLSIPAYLLAAWRKRDLRSNEAGLKYMLMGVFASAIMLYGMSLLYGAAGDTRLEVIAKAITVPDTRPMLTLAALFTVIGFGFKVSAVPFHTWAPDTYEGAPTPLTAFLAVASKAAGFVAMVTIVLIALPGQAKVIEPFMWTLAALTMTVGNLIAMRQSNIVRMLAYSGVAQAGYIMAPLAVFSHAPNQARSAIVTYLVIYAAMNLGAFAVVIAAARKTRSGEISAFGGMFNYAPGLTVAMTVFVFSLAGVPPMGGWLAKWQMFSVLLQSRTAAGTTLAVVAAVNSVVAAFYYLNVAKQMWFLPAPDGDNSKVSVPPSLVAALAITVLATIIMGITSLVPDLTRFADVALSR